MVRALLKSTVVIKIAKSLSLLSLIAISFMHPSQAFGESRSPNDELVFQTVRLQLWYQGLNGEEQDGATLSGLIPSEELQRALMRHVEEETVDFGLKENKSFYKVKEI